MPRSVILHRLKLDRAKRELLEQEGVRVVQTTTVADTLGAARASAEDCVVAASVGTGNRQPEELVAGIHALRVEEIRDVVFVGTTPPGHRNTRRARSLGLDAVYAWPDGAFAHIYKLAVPSPSPSVSMRRIAERAQVSRRLQAGEALGVSARIVNISTSGAMVECAEAPKNLEALGLEFSISGQSYPPIFGRIVWRDDRDGRTRLGLLFIDVSAATSAAIERFVKAANVVAVAERPPGSAIAPGRTVRVTHGKRRDYFQFTKSEEGALLLVPRRAFFVPYQLGDAVELCAHGASQERLQATIVARRIISPERIDSIVAWEIELTQLKKRADLPLPMQEWVEDEASIPNAVSVGVPQKQAPARSSWTTVSDVVEAYQRGEQTLADVTDVIIAPSSSGGPAEFSARTLMVYEGQTTPLPISPKDAVLPIRRSPRLTIGSSPTCDVVLRQPSVSSVHACVAWSAEQSTWQLEDLGSRAGTSVRETPLASAEEKLARGVRRSLRPESIVRVGKQRLHIVPLARLIAEASVLNPRR